MTASSCVSLARRTLDPSLYFLKVVLHKPDIKQHLNNLKPIPRTLSLVQVHPQDHNPEVLQCGFADNFRYAHWLAELWYVWRGCIQYERLPVKHFKCLRCDLAIEQKKGGRSHWTVARSGNGAEGLFPVSMSRGTWLQGNRLGQVRNNWLAQGSVIYAISNLWRQEQEGRSGLNER